ncbi:MAG TPA: UvrD-helicase domain-containing protein [Solirubrobacterales bacterium]|nr:UvrD-helicase domain-containing protein [Solirubrobacterales bacterium]
MATETGLRPIEPGASQVERLLAELNPPQREAVVHGEGPLLVLAGAGSGKTRVLTYRIAYLLATGQAQPSEILAITFTNKAAGEMRERVEQLVGRVSRLMWVMTFHSACARILRAEAERLGYKRAFTIYDQADSLRMVKRCLEELDVDPKRFPPRAIRAQISAAKSQLIDADEYSAAQGSHFERTAADVYRLYERRMLEANAMDFDDLLVRTVNLLELFEDVRERYRRAFRWVLVDEYQDTNRVQYRLLQLLCTERGNLFVVGDDFQSIYAFRHADIRNILEFERDFPETTVVKLEQNYRSTQTILDAANGVIANNRGQKPKRLWTDADAGDPVAIVELDDEHAEARYVASEVERLVTDEGVPRDEIAVFYRVNAQSRVLEDTLVRFEIPYQVIGGTKFYERAEIKDAIAYLSLIANPADAVSFARIVNSPRRGIGQTTEGRLLSHANTTGEDIWDVSARPEQVPGLGPTAVKAVGRFAEVMQGLRERTRGGLAPLGAASGDASPGSGSVAELLEAVLTDSGYLEALESERTIEAEGRIENLRELIGVAGEFDANRELEGESQARPLEEFLAQLALYTDQDALQAEEELCTLMTLHNAKGLEYEAVFMIGCEEGVFPHMRSLEEGNLEEERRLCYVGMTRAKQRLCLTFARRRSLYGGRGHNLRSRFLGEIPDELVERQGAAPTTGWAAAGLGAAVGIGARERARPQSSPLELQVGDDIVHATLGAGVVTGVEPDQVIVVRFAGEATERKLMADYAPLKKV